MSGASADLVAALVMIEQVQRRPLKTDTSVRFIGCGEIDGLSIEQWLAVRKAAGTKIDPNTAEVEWAYRQTLDPYGVYGELPEICQQVGRDYFARSPGSDVWVWFGDLPDATERALWKRYHSKLAFPAGLERIFEIEHETESARPGKSH